MNELIGKLRTGEDERFDVVVFAELPDEEFCEVTGVDKLT